MPEKVTPEEVEKRDLINEINRLNEELTASKSRATTLQSLLENKLDKNDPVTVALLLHYEGVILRQRKTLNNYTEVLWKRKQTIRELREKLRMAEKRNRKSAEVVIPMEASEEHIPQAKTA